MSSFVHHTQSRIAVELLLCMVRKSKEAANTAIQASQDFVKSQRPMAIKCLIKCLCETWDSRENTERMIAQGTKGTLLTPLTVILTSEFILGMIDLR
ncbi:uncharacterized protein [Coffea arabica]|uniref:Uncharacterized protein isoform X2 n=1 Tax=Coffea arabica TaxID=13443 RepID=A0ABM4UDI3_COFAR